MICVDCKKEIPGETNTTITEDLCDMCLCKRLGIDAASMDEAEDILDSMGEVLYELDKWVCSRLPIREV